MKNYQISEDYKNSMGMVLFSQEEIDFLEKEKFLKQPNEKGYGKNEKYNYKWVLAKNVIDLNFLGRVEKRKKSMDLIDSLTDLDKPEEYFRTLWDTINYRFLETPRRSEYYYSDSNITWEVLFGSHEKINWENLVKNSETTQDLEENIWKAFVDVCGNTMKRFGADDFLEKNKQIDYDRAIKLVETSFFLNKNNKQHFKSLLGYTKDENYELLKKVVFSDNKDVIKDIYLENPHFLTNSKYMRKEDGFFNEDVNRGKTFFHNSLWEISKILDKYEEASHKAVAYRWISAPYDEKMILPILNHDFTSENEKNREFFEKMSLPVLKHHFKSQLETKQDFFKEKWEEKKEIWGFRTKNEFVRATIDDNIKLEELKWAFSDHGLKQPLAWKEYKVLNDGLSQGFGIDIVDLYLDVEKSKLGNNWREMNEKRSEIWDAVYGKSLEFEQIASYINLDKSLLGDNFYEISKTRKAIRSELKDGKDIEEIKKDLGLVDKEEQKEKIENVFDDILNKKEDKQKTR